MMRELLFTEILAALRERGILPPSGSAPATVSAFLADPQESTEAIPAILAGHSFTLAAGQSLLLNGHLICAAEDETAGFALGLRVAQDADGGGAVVGSFSAQVASHEDVAVQALEVAPGAISLKEVLGSCAAGTSGASYRITLKNNGASGSATVTVQFRSAVASCLVTAKIGTGCVGLKG